MIRTCLLLLLIVSAGQSFGQKRVFDIRFENIPIDSVLTLVTEKTGYFFSYNSEILPTGSKYSMNETGIDIDRFLNKLLVGIEVEHQIMNDQIILKSRLTPTLTTPERKFFSINGQVRDIDTNEPVSGANVFLSGTNLGGVTDLNGFYMIDRIPVGSYEVIFSHLTYDMVFDEAELLTQGVLTIDAKMNEGARMLDTLEIVSKRLIGADERARFMRIFENEFLGGSANAQKCQVVNPDVLDFIYSPKEDKLEVFALEPVVVINELLGYEITYYFDVFQKIGGYVNFYGKARFRQLKPENAKEQKRWIQSRIKVYNGSFLHFRRALVANELKREQFRMSLVNVEDIDLVAQTTAVKVEQKQVLTALDNGTFRLDFDGFLLVTYRQKPDEMYSEQFFDQAAGRAMQRSFIQLNGGPLLLKSNGRMEYPGMATYGYWYWERVGDLLPENYDPENDSL